MSYSVLPAGEAFWRPSNQMGVLNTDLAKQLGAPDLGARFWRLRPGQASTKHRHCETHELYVVLEGDGRMRIDDDRSCCRGCPRCYVSPDSVRQVFNDTDADVLWLVFGAPPRRRTRSRCPRRRSRSSIRTGRRRRRRSWRR